MWKNKCSEGNWSLDPRQHVQKLKTVSPAGHISNIYVPLEIIIQHLIYIPRTDICAPKMRHFWNNTFPLSPERDVEHGVLEKTGNVTQN